MRVVMLTLLVPIMLATVPVALLDVFLESSDEPIRSAEMDGYRIRLYQLNCGAPCSFMVSVDQERILIRPLMIAERLYVFDEAVDATIEILGKNRLRVRTLPYTDTNPNVRVREFEIRPHFFF